MDGEEVGKNVKNKDTGGRGQRPELYSYLYLHKECLTLVWHGSQPTQEGTKSVH